MAYNFCVRFRESSEEEGQGSLTSQFSVIEARQQDSLATEVTRVLAEHSNLIFDGMDCWFKPETSV